MKKPNFRPNILMGQRFLVSGAVIEKMPKLAALTKKDAVLEIGAGLGALTRALAKDAGRVISVEKDARLFAALTKDLAKERIKNVELICGDILALFPEKLALPKNYKVVANIPYYLTGRLIRRLLETKNPAEEMLLMVQKEVAERMVAKPPHMNLLGLAVQAYARPKIESVVSRNAFQPRPQVDSAIIRLDRIQKNFFRNHRIAEKDFFTLIRAAFHGKRKILINALGRNLGTPKSKLFPVLAKQGFSKKRPAELGLEEWAKLAYALGARIR